MGLVVVAILLLALAGASLDAFQQPPVQQEGFQPFKPGDGTQEVLPATPLVFVAYAFVWVMLLTYVYFLWSRLKRIERELATVSARVQGAARR